MRSAGWLVRLIFGAAVAALVLLAGPLLLFNPWFVSTLQQRQDVAAEFGTSQAEVDRVTSEMLADIFTAGEFDAAFEGEPPLLDADERSHMRDVSRLVRILVAIAGIAAVIAALAGTLMRGDPRRMANVLLVVASLIGAAGITLAVVFAVAFEPAFLAFHALFFPPGTYLFGPGSDLIRLFPEGFWFEASIFAGATVVLSALVVFAIGIVGQARPPSAPRHSG
jgi:integral membrane protein (TIGR01906 family)